MDMPLTEILSLIGVLALGGAAMGLLAGLFGVGGGAISVPLLFELFRFLGHPDTVAMPLAVGTSLAIILPTSLRSAHAHWQRGAVDMGLLRAWALPVLAGVVLGSWLAQFAPPGVFQGAFVLTSSVIAARLLFGKDRWRLGSVLPAGPVLWLYGALTGLMSVLMGIGGGALATMVQTLHGRDIHRAVATSAGVGVLIAVPGTLGYVWAGWGAPGLPADALGYVSGLGLLAFLPTTLLTAPVGARISHQLGKRRLEIAFGLFLCLVSLRFVVALLGG